MSMLIEQSKVLENTFPDPVRSLRAAYYIGIGVCVYIAVLLFVLPMAFFVFLAALIPVGLVLWRLHLRLKDEYLDFYNLFVNRAFECDGLRYHPEEVAARDAEAALPREKRTKKRWVRRSFPPSEAYLQAVDVRKPDGTTFAARYVRHRLVKETAEQCRAMAKHLKKECPLVYKLVSEWWAEKHADAAASQRWIGRTYRELTPAEQKLIRQETEVEFLQGCFIGLAPDTWGKRYDERPYHATHYELRRDLERLIPPKHVPAKVVIDAAPWPEWYRMNRIFQGTGMMIDEEVAAQLHYQRFKPRYQAQSWLKAEEKWPRALTWMPLIGPSLGSAARSTWNLLVPAYARLVEVVTDASTKTGARWVLGLGWRKHAPVWIDYDVDLMQHCGAGGASGYGKTVLTHSLLIAGIENGSSVVWLDPKWDSTTTDLIYFHAERCGRLDDVVFLSVSRGDLPYNSTFNPLGGFFDPSQIGNILAGLMPPDAGTNQAFLEDAKGIGRILGTVCHWLNQYLAELDGTHDLSGRVPKLLLWLEYCRLAGIHRAASEEGAAPSSESDLAAKVATARTRFDAIYERLLAEDRDFKPADAFEKVLLRMWMQPEYTPRYWKLHFGHLLEYGLNNRQRITSWAMRIVYPHICADDPRFCDPFFPLTDTLALVSGEAVANPRSPNAGRDLPLIQVYDRSGPHLLMPNSLVTADQSALLWSHLYEVMLPVERLGRVQTVLESFSRVWPENLGQMKRNPEDFANGLFNLRPIITEIIAGKKYNQFCVPDPHITWKKICDEKKIVIFALGSMSDEKASDAVAKALVQTLIGYIGYNQDGPKADLDLLFIGDEFFSWATETFANIVDKARSSGVRTFVLCQSEAGARYRLGNEDLWKHITTSQRNRFLCNTNSAEDQEAMLDGMGTRPFYLPQRTLSENPAQGTSGNKQVAEWSTGETWTWGTQDLPLIQKDLLGSLPKGVFLRRIQDQFHFFQAPQYPLPAYAKEAKLEIILGKERVPGVRIAGIDFDVRGHVDAERMREWGSAARIGAGLKRAVTVDSTSGGLAPGVRAPEAAPLQTIEILALGEKLAAERIASGEQMASPAGTRIPRPPPPPAMDEEDLEVMCAGIASEAAASGAAAPVPPTVANTAAEPAAAAATPTASPWTLPGMSFGEDEPAVVEVSPALVEVEAADQATALGDPLVEVVDDMEHRGYRDAHGSRFGTWTVHTEGRTVGILRYKDGLLHGQIDRLDAEGRVEDRIFFHEGQQMADTVVNPPVAEHSTPPPGPLPLAIEVTEVDEEGRIHSGRMRDGLRVGTWIVKREDATLAEVQHFHEENGRMIGPWERYDEEGNRIEVFEPAG